MEDALGIKNTVGRGGDITNPNACKEHASMSKDAMEIQKQGPGKEGNLLGSATSSKVAEYGRRST